MINHNNGAQTTSGGTQTHFSVKDVIGLGLVKRDRLGVKHAYCVLILRKALG
jgi:hypothetical protein